MTDETINNKQILSDGKNAYLAKWYASQAEAEKDHSDFRPTADFYIRFSHEIIPLIRDMEEIDNTVYSDPEQALLACGSFILKAIEHGGDPVVSMKAVAAFTYRLAAYHHGASLTGTGEVTEDLPTDSGNETQG